MPPIPLGWEGTKGEIDDKYNFIALRKRKESSKPNQGPSEPDLSQKRHDLNISTGEEGTIERPQADENQIEKTLAMKHSQYPGNGDMPQKEGSLFLPDTDSLAL